MMFVFTLDEESFCRLGDDFGRIKWYMQYLGAALLITFHQSFVNP